MKKKETTFWEWFAIYGWLIFAAVWAITVLFAILYFSSSEPHFRITKENCWNETRPYSQTYIPPTKNNPTASGIHDDFDRYEVIGCYEEYINMEGEEDLGEIECNLTEANKNLLYNNLCGDCPCGCSDSPFRFYNNNSFYIKYRVYKNPIKEICETIQITEEEFMRGFFNIPEVADVNIKLTDTWLIGNCEWDWEGEPGKIEYKCKEWVVESWEQIK